MALLTTALLAVACSSGGGGEGNFRLIEFLEAGQNNIPRNRQVSFRFSSAVNEDQDLASRLRIQNVIQEEPANFASARGFYLVNGEEVVFTPRLPQLPDRSDAGFKEDGSYHVFISGGTNGLQSTSGDRVPTQQEFLFETNIFFEDIIPAQPPRSVNLVAFDRTNDATIDVSRLDPRPVELAKLDNATLIANGRVIDPGAGGAPDYATPWHFDLRVTEPTDPASITSKQVEMFEVYSDAMDLANNQASANHFGTPVNFRVAVTVEAVQSIDPATGDYDLRIRVTPQGTLVDNTRYRLSISGAILGLDFRKTFSGDNGLTGDGATVVDGLVHSEPGGLGYVTEFLVADRPFISAQRTLLYDPIEDGILPETGQTALDPENQSNSALYNPALRPGSAVGFLSAFGTGTDGPLAITGQQVINTGDTPNEPLGKPFTVLDLNPNDQYTGNPLPGATVTYDSVEPFELQLESFTVSTTGSLRFEGVNPVMMRVTGIVQVNGVVDLAGTNGGSGGGQFASGGDAGAGGFAGASAGGGGGQNCYPSSRTCANFSSYLNACNPGGFPSARNGEGPGRGYAGGEVWTNYSQDTKNAMGSAAGGGGSHGTAGGRGEDRMNPSGTPGTAGRCASGQTWQVRVSGVIGVRSMPGATYGDREVIDNNMGGSGGGSGGANFAWSSQYGRGGGGGGGGGGSIQIVAASSILLQGGLIDASGGNGGRGAVSSTNTSQNWDKAMGGGGGGAGGSIVLISGGEMALTGGLLDAAGGAGGVRGNVGTTKTCNMCNAGGDGGQGFIYLMDADGEIEGFIPNRPGEYDTDPRGVMTISEFNADRFSSITAVTELFPVTAANPAYQDYDKDGSGYLPQGDDSIEGIVADGQSIAIVVSSAKSNADDPLLPDLLSEITPFEVALVEFKNGGTAVKITGNMSDLNVTPGSPDREAFIRVQAKFAYTNSVEAALGPYAAIDRVNIAYTFNG
ncbi:MAG: hypothetical protein ACYS0E_11785 [Planctomycetota bacterium]|jgi:hypothetical protein